MVTLKMLLGAAILASAVSMGAGSWADQAVLPGESVPDAVATRLVGGACGDEVTIECLDGTGVKKECKVREINRYDPPGDWQANKRDYCGVKVNGVLKCESLPITSKKCGSGIIVGAN